MPKGRGFRAEHLMNTSHDLMINDHEIADLRARVEQVETERDAMQARLAQVAKTNAILFLESVETVAGSGDPLKDALTWLAQREAKLKDQIAAMRLALNDARITLRYINETGLLCGASLEYREKVSDVIEACVGALAQNEVATSESRPA